MYALARLTAGRAPRPLRARGAPPGSNERGDDPPRLRCEGACREPEPDPGPYHPYPWAAPAHGADDPAPTTRGDRPASDPAVAGGPRLRVTVEIDFADLARAIETFKMSLPASARIEARPALGSSQAQEPCASLALTARQWQVLALIGEGLSNKAIARRLGLSHFTVRNHLSQILLTMGLASRQQARTAFAAFDPRGLGGRGGRNPRDGVMSVWVSDGACGARGFRGGGVGRSHASADGPGFRCAIPPRQG
jgi:DNA-binding CsgD family transcriptional regulator